jgi:hypothetical protein
MSFNFTTSVDFATPDIIFALLLKYDVNKTKRIAFLKEYANDNEYFSFKLIKDRDLGIFYEDNDDPTNPRKLFAENMMKKSENNYKIREEAGYEKESLLKAMHEFTQKMVSSNPISVKKLMETFKVEPVKRLYFTVKGVINIMEVLPVESVPSLMSSHIDIMVLWVILQKEKEEGGEEGGEEGEGGVEEGGVE